MMHGEGIYTWLDGRFYHGSYKNDKKEGYGVYRWADGRIYLGHWVQGKQHGIGIYVLPNGIIKKVEFKNGQRVRFLDDSNIDEEEALSKKAEMETVKQEVQASSKERDIKKEQFEHYFELNFNNSKYSAPAMNFEESNQPVMQFAVD
jgi:hypothetical protein